jgi:hypothetical protein
MGISTHMIPLLHPSRKEDIARCSRWDYNDEKHAGGRTVVFLNTDFLKNDDDRVSRWLEQVENRML